MAIQEPPAQGTNLIGLTKKRLQGRAVDALQGLRPRLDLGAYHLRRL